MTKIEFLELGLLELIETARRMKNIVTDDFTDEDITKLDDKEAMADLCRLRSWEEEEKAGRIKKAVRIRKVIK